MRDAKVLRRSCQFARVAEGDAGSRSAEVQRQRSDKCGGGGKVGREAVGLIVWLLHLGYGMPFVPSHWWCEDWPSRSRSLSATVRPDAGSWPGSASVCNATRRSPTTAVNRLVCREAAQLRSSKDSGNSSSRNRGIMIGSATNANYPGIP